MNPRGVFTMALVDYRRGLIAWAVATFLGVVLMCAFYPALVGIEGLDELLAAYPEALLSLFGIERGSDFTSAVGYLEGEVFSFMVPLTVIGFGVAIGARFVAGEEERGTIGLTLARPVARSRYVVAKFAGLAVLTLALAVVVVLALVVAGPVFGLRVPFDRILAVVTPTTALGVLHGTIALAAGSATGRKAAATAAGWGLAILGYLWSGLAPITRGLEEFAGLSPYEWAFGEHPLRSGWDAAGLASLALATAVVLAFAVAAFERRDVAG